VSAALGLRLLERLGAGATAFSPHGVHTALATIREGASGAARAALDDVLGPEPPVTVELDDDGVAVALAHALWIDREYRLVAPIAEARTIDFGDPGAPAEVNAWAAEATYGMVPSVIDGFEEDEKLALLGAAYFDGAWTVPFDRAEPAPFTRPDGSTVEVPTMAAAGRYEHGRHGGLEAIRLPYGNELQLGFIAVIADDGLEPPLPTHDEWEALRAAMRYEAGSVSLPRLRARAALDLRDPLIGLGLGPAFDPGADWSGLFEGDGGKALNRVLQRARVDVDEQGTRAAAVTVVTAVAVSAPLDPFDLRLDRPFLWAVEDHRTGTLLFLGIVTDPTSEEST
jgi:serpin B